MARIVVRGDRSGPSAVTVASRAPATGTPSGRRRHQGGEAARQLAVQRHHVRGLHVRLHVLETAVRQACQRRREHHTTGVAPTWQGGKGLDGEPQPDAVRSGIEVGDQLDVGGGQHLVGPPEGHGSDWRLAA